MSVRPSAWNNSDPTGRILIKHSHLGVFRKLVEKIKFSLKSDKNKRYFNHCFFSFMTTFCYILLRMKNILHKKCRENQNTYFMFNAFFFLKSCRLWDNVEKYGESRGATIGAYELHAGKARLHARTHMHTRTRLGARTQICHICCFSTATTIRKRASELRYTYIIYLVVWIEYTSVRCNIPT